MRAAQNGFFTEEKYTWIGGAEGDSTGRGWKPPGTNPVRSRSRSERAEQRDLKGLAEIGKKPEKTCGQH